MLDSPESEQDSDPELKSSQQCVDLHNLAIDDFVIIELKTVKGLARRFIGKLIQQNPYRCSYLKQSTKIKNAFVFPQVPDESDVDANEFIVKLPHPKVLRRGALSFDVDLMQKFYFR